MKNKKELYYLDNNELINEVLILQRKLNDLKVNEAESSYIHNYHFSSNELLKLSRESMMGSGVILTLHSLNGKPIIRPTLFKDGLSKETVNSLIEDMQYSYDQAISLKPTSERLK